MTWDKIKWDKNGQNVNAWLWAKTSRIRHLIGKHVFVQTKVNGLSYSFLVIFDACFLNFTFQVALVLNWSLMQRLTMSKVQGAQMICKMLIVVSQIDVINYLFIWPSIKPFRSNWTKIEMEQNGSDFFTEPQEFPRLGRKVFSTFFDISNFFKHFEKIKGSQNGTKWIKTRQKQNFNRASKISKYGRKISIFVSIWISTVVKILQMSNKIDEPLGIDKIPVF